MGLLNARCSVKDIPFIFSLILHFCVLFCFSFDAAGIKGKLRPEGMVLTGYHRAA